MRRTDGIFGSPRRWLKERDALLSRKCPVCGSVSDIVITGKTQSYICRRCFRIWESYDK